MTVRESENESGQQVDNTGMDERGDRLDKSDPPQETVHATVSEMHDRTDSRVANRNRGCDRLHLNCPSQAKGKGSPKKIQVP